MDQIAVVFGATGMVGKELIYELLENSRFIKIVAVVRQNLPVSHHRLEKIVIKDYAELSSIKDRLIANVYFCCIGTTIKKAGTQEEFRRVDFEIPVQIAQLAKELNIPSLVVVSSIGANTESSAFYLRTKGEMEKMIIKSFEGNLKIIRPSLLMGHRSEFRFGEKVAVLFMKTFGFLMIGPFKKYRGIYAWDVARAMIKLIETGKEKLYIESDELFKLSSVKN